MVSAEETPSTFNRGDRVSASVRLRQANRKEEQLSKKKRNRHSGDFGFFSSSTKADHPPNGGDHSSDEDLKDWSYINFPHGKPDVLEGKKKNPLLEGSRELKMTPVKVVTREVPGLLPLRPLSTHIGGKSSPGPEFPKNQRLSGDFGNKKKERRRSEVLLSSTTASASTVSAGEFEFTKASKPAPLVEEEESLEDEVGDDSSGDEELLLITPPPSHKKLLQAKIAAGLGRRSITSVNLNSNKKQNSYRSALCKSQENLVKATAFNSGTSTSSSSAELLSLEKDTSTLKKGLLWQQRDKLFSRWKERYFILSPDYLHCFKRRTSRITEMGEFIFKIKLGEVEEVELLDKRGYLTICISLPREGKVYLRKTEGIREWYSLLKDCVRDCRKKRRESGVPLFKKQNTDSTSIEKWILDRKKIGLQHSYSDSTPEISKILPSSPRIKSSSERVEITLEELNDLYKNEEEEQDRLRRRIHHVAPEAHHHHPHHHLFPSPQQQDIKRRSSTGIKPSLAAATSVNNASQNETKKINRLSLMSDIELPDCCSSTDLGIDLEKGIFLRKKYLTPGDAESNDSGNNSMNTNGSVGSTTSSSGSNRCTGEERLETHFENLNVRDRSSSEAAFKNRELKSRRRSSQHVVVPGLQITHV
eukprot:TRINITY_DN846_c0_g3_i1.p1 TRINITY_DN846_c0_g3~~TRINITY_DN846_c0_g3_i1.p1  ORF type:complete len:645 (+),score=231.04 TRINITY_DN846_c0_g3_i1:219-2153(+)